MYNVLWIDLTDEDFWEEEVDDALVRDFIGGKGLAARLLCEHLPPRVEPLSPGNLLIFAAGPLTGTPAPSSGRASASAKSPLTGTIFESHCGGRIGYHLRRAGYLAVVISGRAEQKTLLRISRGKVEFESAARLWGRGTRETEREIKQKPGWGRCSVACIGIAGERLVRFASIIHEGHRAFGRGGLGAVMGSKNLKALAIRGEGSVELARPEEFKRKVRECHAKLAEHPTTGKVLKLYGTPNVLAKVNYAGLLPTRNFSEGVFEGADEISAEALAKHIRGSYGCYVCAIRCGKVVEVGGVRTTSLEYETLFALGANVGVANLRWLVEFNELCNDLGMDTISAGGTIAAYIESRQGAIAWGDAERVYALLEDIAHRRGEGEALAEGSARALPEYSVSVKGLELPGYDPRGARGVALAYATSNRGACHLRAPVYIEEILTQSVDRRSREGKAALVKQLQDLHSALDSLILCKFTARALTAEDYAELLSLATGIEFTAEDLVTAGERIFNLERVFNLGEGLSSKDDALPERLLTQPIPEGPSRGMRAELEILEEYYRLRGWSSAGVPTREKLRQLGIDYILRARS
ncbi:MAG: aldehyde ferredoxin oxidoreductase family protein [Euryarchaeota archaeon]|nr:aldehyde ferredoxin oxidoreductase family protein [Euryarchaeota archaeon]